MITSKNNIGSLRLIQIQIEHLINETPTSTFRNDLTLLNIMIEGIILKHKIKLENNDRKRKN
jgi:hypothetical protein